MFQGSAHLPLAAVQPPLGLALPYLVARASGRQEASKGALLCSLVVLVGYPLYNLVKRLEKHRAYFWCSSYYVNLSDHASGFTLSALVVVLVPLALGRNASGGWPWSWGNGLFRSPWAERAAIVLVSIVSVIDVVAAVASVGSADCTERPAAFP